MAKRTLLDMTQGILSKLDADEINSIGDTIESTQVAEIIRDVYYDMVDELDLPAHRNLFALTGLADATAPSKMLIPDNVSKVLSVQYDTRTEAGDAKSYQVITYLEPIEFVRLCNQRDSTDTTNNLVVNPSTSISLVIDIGNQPSFWTSFDDEYIYFDATDTGLDSTMQSSKTICEGYLRPTFTLTDTFIPDLPENLFPLLYRTSEAAAFVYGKQAQNPTSEIAARHLRIRAMRNKWRTKRETYDGPHYGRK